MGLSSRVGILVVASMLFGSVSAAQELTIYIGPQIRDGFADVDAGINDSIGDLGKEFARTTFKIVEKPEAATVRLIVLGRGVVNQGSVGGGATTGFGGNVTGVMSVVPNNVPTLSTMLRVGTYERLMQSSGSNWTRAAQAAVTDVMTWWNWNEEALRTRKQRGSVVRVHCASSFV